MFEEVILENSQEQIAKLYGPAARAADKPDTGVEIKKKAAYFVIRDCAGMTRKYLPIHIWGLFNDPILDLKGKFTSNEVKNFLERAKTETDAILLKKLILSDIKEKYEVIQSSSGSATVSYEADEADIYSYYEEYEEGLDDSTETGDSEEEALTDDQLILKYLF
jgi:hypothetical protein|tara:strand:- start:13 stop:504 length:492 start_codon:yes stop_codon:yes gene_type:complete